MHQTRHSLQRVYHVVPAPGIILILGAILLDPLCATLAQLPVSTDRAIQAPYMAQFLAEPYYIGMPAITTAAGGVTFPPAVDDTIGFSLVGIDYDEWIPQWQSCIGVVPWQGLGLQTMTFVE